MKKYLLKDLEPVHGEIVEIFNKAVEKKDYELADALLVIHGRISEEQNRRYQEKKKKAHV